MLVLDASMALAWLLERQTGEETAVAERALNALAEQEVCVPALWHLEVGNALLVAERRGVVSEARISAFLHHLDELPIQTDETPVGSLRGPVMAAAREHGLSAYDGAYLELALRNGSTLATFDRKLAAAMERAGGGLFK